MNSIEDIFPAVWARKRPIALSALLLGFVLAVFSITGYFRLSSEASALRRSVMNSAGGEWHKKDRCAHRIFHNRLDTVGFAVLQRAARSTRSDRQCAGRGSWHLHLPPGTWLFQSRRSICRSGQVHEGAWLDSSSGGGAGQSISCGLHAAKSHFYQQRELLRDGFA
jgi:hypothetical protein